MQIVVSARPEREREKWKTSPDAAQLGETHKTMNNIHIMCSYLRSEYIWRRFCYGLSLSLLHRLTNVLLEFHIVNYFIFSVFNWDEENWIFFMCGRKTLFGQNFIFQPPVINFHLNMSQKWNCSRNILKRFFFNLSVREEQQNNFNCITLSRGMTINF